MNRNKVAFILCANEERQLNECLGYLDRLVIPEGYEKDVIAVSEAPSMAAGYNAGMQSSDAKYKVYIHQDTFIINPYFISDMLKVFEDKDVGLIGMVGARKLPRDSYAVTAWDTGKVYHNGTTIIGYQEKERNYIEVEAVDGLLLATQYDINFREDLFTDWDFYDISACFEFRRAGYKVVVPYQDECWVFHDNKYSKMLNYDKNRAIFAKEYSRDFSIDKEICPEPIQELEKVKGEAIEHFTNLINEGRMEVVCKALLSNEEFNFNCLRDITILATIYQNYPECTIFRWDENANELFARLNDLKWFLKRVEYDVCMEDEEYRFFVDNYGVQAIVQVCGYYCIKQKRVIKKLNKYIQNQAITSFLEQRLEDNMDFMNIIKSMDHCKIYNEANSEDKKIIVVIDYSTHDRNVKNYLDILMKCGNKEDIIIFSREDHGYVEEFVKNNIPVIINKAASAAIASVVIYFMKCEWNIQDVIYLGEGKYVEAVRRSIANLPIKGKSLLQCIDEAYENNDYRKYEIMADYFENDNTNQAYICLQQALFYVKEDETVTRIQERLQKMNPLCAKRVSIVLLSYNTLELTKGCIESLRTSTDNRQFELIVVDNASTDGSIDYLKQQADIKLICNDVNMGFAGGCNQGIKAAEPDNDIWLLNSDTLVPEHALFWLKMGLYDNGQVGSCGSVSNYCPNYQNTIETEVNIENYQEVAEKYNHYMENALEKKNWLVGFSMLIKREALEKVGYLDEQFFPGNYEDNDLSYRLLRAGYSLHLCHNSFVFHYGSQSFKKTNMVSQSLIENKERFVKKWDFNPELYTEIKSRLIAMLKEAQQAEFSVLDLNAGVGATLARLEYMYPNVFAAGMEQNTKVAEIAQLNGHVIAESFNRRFDYVIDENINKSSLRLAESYLKEHGTLIGSCYNSYYKELVQDVSAMSASTGEELLQLLEDNGYMVSELSFVRGESYDTQRAMQLCKKYNCNESLVIAKKFYFVAKKTN